MALVLGSFGRIAALSLLGMMAACSPKPSARIANPLDCFPKEARAWISRARSGPTDAAPPEQTPGRATIYVDRSGSMAGYIRGATNLDTPLQDLVSDLPTGLRLIHVPKVAFRAFGTQISDELPNAGQSLTEIAAYHCHQAAGAVCDNAESRLDRVLETVGTRNDDLAIIISDLWFENSEVRSTGVGALQPALADLLLAGKAVAVYGISAPFDGTIYDLPRAGVGKMAQPYAGRHPIYMLAVGSPETVSKVDEALDRMGSRPISQARHAGAIKRSIFLVDAVDAAAAKAQALTEPKNPRIRRNVFRIPPGVAMQRFALRSAPAPAAGAQAAPQWSGPNAEDFRPDTVWSGPLQTRTRIWQRKGEACSAQGWVAQNVGDEGWSQGGSGRGTFTLDPDRFSAAFAQRGTYLVVGEVGRTTIDRPNRATAWMRGEWDLDPARAEALAGTQPAIFPTLNLSEFSRIMEAALASAIERKPRPLIGFAVMVKTDP